MIVRMRYMKRDNDYEKSLSYSIIIKVIHWNSFFSTKLWNLQVHLHLFLNRILNIIFDCVRRSSWTATILDTLLHIRDLPRFVDQVGHQTTNTSIGNKHFFTNYWTRLAYQNYEQPCERCQNSEFQSHFSVSKIGRIFPKKNFCEEYLIRRPTYINEIFWKLWFLKYFIY